MSHLHTFMMLVVVCGLAHGDRGSVKQSSLPNIILFLVDDVSYVLDICILASNVATSYI